MMADEDRTDVMNFSFDPNEDYEPVDTIIQAVAWVKNVDPTALEPLQRTIDVGGLMTLVKSDRPPVYRRSMTTEAVNPRVMFRYEGCKVTVGDERVWIETD